jgi:hypothetical protein
MDWAYPNFRGARNKEIKPGFGVSTPPRIQVTFSHYMKPAGSRRFYSPVQLFMATATNPLSSGLQRTSTAIITAYCQLHARGLLTPPRIQVTLSQCMKPAKDRRFYSPVQLFMATATTPLSSGLQRTSTAIITAYCQLHARGL